jgi:quercetin dioxygenase-like cupin family protein
MDVDSILRDIEQSANKVAGLVSRQNNVMHYETDNPLIKMACIPLYEDDEIQIFKCIHPPHTSISSHRHRESWEVFFVLDGSVEIAGEILNKGDCVRINTNVEHFPKTNKNGAVYLAIIYPKEEGYV